MPQDINIQAGFNIGQVRALATVMNVLLADVFALYMKTKNFHWHMSGPQFRDYHLLLDEQATQIYDISDDIAERVRKTGGTTLRSISSVAALQTIVDNNEEYVSPQDMLTELLADNQKLIADLRQAHGVASGIRDVATTALIEVWIDEAERRAWFLFEATRPDADDTE